jgi:hypothetical protein
MQWLGRCRVRPDDGLRAQLRQAVGVVPVDGIVQTLDHADERGRA